MSDHRYTAIFGGALLTAGVATFAVYRMLGTAASPKHEPVRAVVVAVRDVPAGVAVPREALGIASWPVRIAPPESFAAADSIIGRVTRVPLMSGEPVLTTRLAARGAAPGLEGTIDPTRRAMAVRVNEAASVSGLVRSNSRVDVLMAARADGGTQPTARVLMSDVRVLGVGSVRPPEPSGGTAADAPTPNTTTAAIVTLEVTPAQAELLAAAESQGAIQVVLRGYGSVGNADASPPDLARAVALPGLSEAPVGSARVGGLGVAAVGGMGAGAATPPRAAASSSARSAAHHARHLEGAPVSAAVATASSQRTINAMARAEPTTIQVYRGGAMTTLRLDAAGSPGAASSSSVGGAPRAAGGSATADAAAAGGFGSTPPSTGHVASAHAGLSVAP